jgi:hypothetical protein
VILHGDALAQRFVQLQRKSAAQQRLAYQEQGQIAIGIGRRGASLSAGIGSGDEADFARSRCKVLTGK